MISQATIDALRTTPTTKEQDHDLKESLRDGWWPHEPAIRDEHDVVLVGGRRLRLARELGIEPVVETIVFGEGEEADEQRVRRALNSNTSAPTTAASKRAFAISLLTKENWIQERIARNVRVTQKTVSGYLKGIYTPGINSPSREEKRGRPKKPPPPVEMPKPVAARVVEAPTVERVRAAPEATTENEKIIAALREELAVAPEATEYEETIAALERNVARLEAELKAARARITEQARAFDDLMAQAQAFSDELKRRDAKPKKVKVARRRQNPEARPSA